MNEPKQSKHIGSLREVILLIRYRVNSTWLILGGGIIGMASALL